MSHISDPFPLDILSSIFEEVKGVTDTRVSYVWYTPRNIWKETLQACSLVCRHWRPLAQRFLLKKIVLVDPKWRKTHGVPRSNHPSLSTLLEAIEADDAQAWLSYVQVLHVHGRWVISDPHFPQILDSFAQCGQLRSFLWSMRCHKDCAHWYKFPEIFRTSLEAIMSCPKLTSVRLRGTCKQFPIEILGYSPLQHLEFSADQGLMKAPKPRRKKGQIERPPTPMREPADTKAPIQLFELESGTSILDYYVKRQDCRLDFSSLKELIIINFDGLGFMETVLESASQTLETLTWTFEDPGRADLSYMDDSIKGISFQNLTSLKTLKIEARKTRCQLYSSDYYPYFNHLCLILKILEHCGVPKSLEVINISLEETERFEWYRQEKISFDEKLSASLKAFLMTAQIKAINIRILTLMKWALKQERDKLRTKYGVYSDTSDSEEEFPYRKLQTTRPKRRGEEITSWLAQNPGKNDDDFFEEQCRANGATSDDEYTYLSWKYYRSKIVKKFPLLQGIDIVHLEAIDDQDYISYRPNRDIW